MSGLFFTRLFEAPWEYLAWVLIVMFSVCVHEFAHAWFAVRRGDSTAAELGHLCLDPARQMGIQAILMLLIFGLTWGAVQVSPRRLRPLDRVLVSLAGPVANLLLMVAFSAASALLLRWTPQIRVEGAPWLLAYAARANATLALLNLLPLPPLDGWGVVEALVPRLEDAAERAGSLLAWLALAVIFLTPAGVLIWVGGARLASATLALLV
ncbi:MAG: site-2 protease family protein [Kiritimatiellae bacterium]|nr:site-2 protease family protein [Kiritimatiellia bacterium]